MNGKRVELKSGLVDRLKEDQGMILVVDDDKGIQTILRAALEHAGYEVVTSLDGADAYEQVSSSECECMLLDMTMPHINGPELLLLM